MDSYAKKSNVLGLIINGTFYCPAFKHYSESPLNVECSVCGKSNLVSAIGYGSRDGQDSSYDFCLECVDKITNSFNFNSKKISNQNQFSSNINNLEMFSSNSNNILASNDFSNGGSSWEDQFMSSLNPTVSGMSKNKFNYDGFTNNSNSLNNPNGSNYLENFFQPLNPNGLKRR